MKIGIIDYGMGNLGSISNALSYIGVDYIISSDVQELEKTDKLILPGVGAFKDAINLIKEKKIDLFIHDSVKKGKPLLGICLGMQLLFDSSSEYGSHEGLGLLHGDIVRFDTNLKVPHMGWNKLNIVKEEPLFKGLPKNIHVYFVHSYHLETSEDIVCATTNYGKEIQIAAQKDNIFALQFHPEKSGVIGLSILRNFVSL
ncbi:imidazole glycerol phosphate synthase subunit HisH [Vallitalea guaymasensis]|uniref:Imidazole glycerol phosphate synthase subunit HisH n=1 Tax=Vallitalea guaymasensis TaxID=1185412 RepID=A0A8J8MER3_9FIRM|nr:imidazole glycerol phosphate synthase subunit HisH [Vallitalea guaymasensis]QUH31533.1 imidazole glycerol phosphate synthase subunit HisH [Vallitalea guaymasensis]